MPNRRNLILRIGLALLVSANTVKAGTMYLSPEAIVADPAGKTLYITEATANQVAAWDIAAAKVARIFPLPDPPTGLALSPDGARLYITGASPAGRVHILDVRSGSLLASLPSGHTPTAPAVSPDGQTLYVCNRFNNSLAIFDLKTNRQVATVPVSREPVATAITSDGRTVFVANLLPSGSADAGTVAALVSVMDTEARKVTASIQLPNGSTSVHGLCLSPGSKYLYVTHVLARYRLPTTQLDRGWVNTAALSIIDAARLTLINTVLLDEIDLGAANPWGVACTADGKTLCVAHSGTHEISVIDRPRLHEKLATRDPVAAGRVPGENRVAGRSPREPGDGWHGQAESYPAELARGPLSQTVVQTAPTTATADVGASVASSSAPDTQDDLSFLLGLRRRLKLPGNGPRGLAIVGATAYAAEYFTDSLAAVDIRASGGAGILPASMPQVGTPALELSLAPSQPLIDARRGEMLFHDATICFQQWQSCATCHPGSARTDGLNWDLLNDGLGTPRNNKSLLLAYQTPPSMAMGVRSDAGLAVRAGIRHVLFADRLEEDAVALDAYLKSLQPVPSPYLVNGQLSPAALRGQKVFDQAGCARCHVPPLYTDLESYDVGTAKGPDAGHPLDTPTLIEAWRTAPYLHDGRAATLAEVFTKHNPTNKHGVTSGLTAEQINDLVEFVLSQ